MSPNCTFPQHGERLNQTDCLPPAANTTGESLAALAGGGQGEGSDMLRGELSHPIGFWFTCHNLLAFLPSEFVRAERRS